MDLRLFYFHVTSYNKQFIKNAKADMENVIFVEVHGVNGTSQIQPEKEAPPQEPMLLEKSSIHKKCNRNVIVSELPVQCRQNFS